MIIALPLICALATPAFASKIMSGGMPGNCEMKENITLNVQFNRKVASFEEAKKIFSDMTSKIEEMAKQQGIGALTLQNQNYNVSASPQGYAPDGATPLAFTYQVGGNASYKMDNADAAFKFAEFLITQKMQVGLNSNSYRQGNCQAQ